MKDLFLQLLEMSFTASVLVGAVAILRLTLKKAPKNMTIWLWLPVLIRLICPISFESMFSLMPRSDFVPAYSAVIMDSTPAIQDVTNTPSVSQIASPPDMLSIASTVWIVGVMAMLAYTFVTYAVLKYRMREAVPLEGRVWLSDRAATPYILGVVAPKIYLPSSMSSADHSYVIAHEQSHLKRGDHIVKPLAFVLLSVYWFNPFMWVAYILLCRDIELACDERVIRDYKSKRKVKAYSSVLLRCSVSKRSIAACPVAFGETAVSSRVRAILSYKKPTFWIMLITAVVGVVLTVCFLTDPQSSEAASHKVPDSSPVVVTQTTALPTQTSTVTTSQQFETSSTTSRTTQETTTATTTTAPATVPATVATTVPTTVPTIVYTTAPTAAPTKIEIVIPSINYEIPEIKVPTLPPNHYIPKAEPTSSGIRWDPLPPRLPTPENRPNVPGVQW